MSNFKIIIFITLFTNIIYSANIKDTKDTKKENSKTSKNTKTIKQSKKTKKTKKTKNKKNNKNSKNKKSQKEITQKKIIRPINNTNDIRYKMSEELIENIKKNESENKKIKKEYSVNINVAKIIEKKNQSIKNATQNNDYQTTNQIEKKNIKPLNRIKKTNDVTQNFNNYLMKINTKHQKLKYKKYQKPIKHIDFLQLDCFNIATFLRNTYRKNSYFYELDVRLINILFGFNMSTGINCGFSAIKKCSSKNTPFFANINIGYKYARNGHIEFAIGMSRVKYDQISYWPIWYSITPINIKQELYKFKKQPMSLMLNIQILFKGIISEDITDFTSSFRTIDKNKIIPYIGDLSNPNFLKTFIDIKIYLGFRYYPNT